MDKKMDSCHNPCCAARQVYLVHQGGNKNIQDINECTVNVFDMTTDELFGINATFLEINAAARTRHGLNIPTEGWYSLSEEGKTTWDMLSVDDKMSIISSLTLQNRISTRNSAKPSKDFSNNNHCFPCTKQQQVQVHTKCRTIKDGQHTLNGVHGDSSKGNGSADFAHGQAHSHGRVIQLPTHNY